MDGTTIPFGFLWGKRPEFFPDGENVKWQWRNIAWTKETVQSPASVSIVISRLDGICVQSPATVSSELVGWMVYVSKVQQL